jgi:glutamine amidotransferase
MATIIIVDYGAGNLGSVRKGLAAVGGDARVAASARLLSDAAAIVIPGVGHFGATAALDDTWRRAIAGRVDAGASLLGICLGMQWLFDGSDEAPDLTGLGRCGGRCVRLTGDVKVPHVGWNTLQRSCRPSRLLDGVPRDASVYFTHAFAAPLTEDAVAMTTHGVTFASAVERGRIWGTQFHPEKSGVAGLRVLANFVAAAGEAR